MIPMRSKDRRSSRLLFIVNIPEFFVSHRLPIGVASLKSGYEVHVATAPGAAVSEIVGEGIKHHALSISRSGLHPIREVRTFFEICRLLRSLRPDIVHLVTIKPVLYAGIAARLSGVRAIVAAVPGLGFVFTATGMFAKVRRSIVVLLYRIALSKQNVRVIFQNADDCREFVERRIVVPNRVTIIPGSGVNLAAYPEMPEPDNGLVVTFVGRLLRDKGVCEYADAAQILKGQGINAEFWLVGDMDPDNPASISRRELDLWRQDNVLKFRGYRNDIPQIIADSHLIVLPSYREGFPKVLVEAAACGRAIVTTDVPGCRDAILPGKTGLLVPMRNASALAAAIRRLLEDEDLRKRMGREGRKLAERKFSIDMIVSAHLEIYFELASQQ